jgi:hypothetical protein
MCSLQPLSTDVLRELQGNIEEVKYVEFDEYVKSVT